MLTIHVPRHVPRFGRQPKTLRTGVLDILRWCDDGLFEFVAKLSVESEYCVPVCSLSWFLVVSEIGFFFSDVYN